MIILRYIQWHTVTNHSFPKTQTRNPLTRSNSTQRPLRLLVTPCLSKFIKWYSSSLRRIYLALIRRFLLYPADSTHIVSICWQWMKDLWQLQKSRSAGLLSYDWVWLGKFGGLGLLSSFTTCPIDTPLAQVGKRSKMYGDVWQSRECSVRPRQTCGSGQGTHSHHCFNPDGIKLRWLRCGRCVNKWENWAQKKVIMTRQSCTTKRPRTSTNRM